MGVGSRRRFGVASTVAVALVASLLGWFAVRSQGAVVHQADLWDGGVWVSNDSQARFGRVNKPIGQLDAGVAVDVAAGSGLDLLQDGAAVVGLSTSTGGIYPIDTQLGRLGSVAASVPPVTAQTGLQFYQPLGANLRGGTIAMVDGATGKVWAQRVDSRTGVTDLASLGGKPLATVGANAAVTVDVAGNVHAVSGATGKVVTIPATPGGFGTPVTETIEVETKTVDITAVGTRWVVYDPTKDALWVQGEDKQIDGGIQQAQDQSVYAALQQPGPEADFVAIEGLDAVHIVGLGGGSPKNGGVTVPDQQTAGGPVSGNARGLRVTRPVVLGACVYGAWSSTAAVLYNVNCGKQDPVPAVSLARTSGVPSRAGVSFRVNRNLIVLNDEDDGSVWDVDNKNIKIDNWDALTPPTSKDDKDKKNKNIIDDSTRAEPPKAEPDQMRVRAGRTSVLHVLDNDSDPSGGILALVPGRLSSPNVAGVTTAISGDGQAVDLTVPDTVAKRSFTFSYEVDNPSKARAKATVTVTVVDDATNSPPVLRPGGAKLASSVYPVIPGHHVALQVLGDWRDPENDPVSVEARSAGTTVDGTGRLNVLAPAKPGVLGLPFGIADDRGATTPATANVTVLDPVNGRPVAPKTQPDSVRGVVGKPIQIEPLGNDIPGADPTDPDATLALSAPLASTGALKVDTDIATGTVTVVPRAAGTFELSYGAQVGTVAAPGRIRIDVAPARQDLTPPVAVPDTAVLRDQSPALVDVLANDSSPRSDVLVTQSVVNGADSDWLRASIFQGRWVRVEATDPAALSADATRRGTLRYTVSDGTKSATGTVQVVQRGPLTTALPVVADDTAVVRVGDVVTIPVLDNDTMAGGIPLRIDPASVKVIAGAKQQNAFLSGNTVRYVPEDDQATLRTTKQVTLEYAAYPESLPEKAQTGRVTVTVKPLPSAALPNQAPIARSFTSSVTAGEALTITVPTSGVDPDGDTLTVKGIAGSDSGGVELRLGRVVSFGPNTIRYESYPNASGTEILSYLVTDRFGAAAQGFVRIGVVPPSDPQPPVAVQDQITAAPGKKVTVPFLANDLIARGDSVSVGYRDLNDATALRQWKVDESAFTVTTTAPEQGAQAHQFQYAIDDGLFDPSRASVLVLGLKGAKNPPTALDDVAKPGVGQDTALVDVQANDSDVDSAPGTLKIGSVLSPTAAIEGTKVRVRILDHPYAVPYVIADDDGLTAMALIYVPTGDKGNPFVVSSAVISMGKNATKNVALNDYVKSPRGRKVSVTAVSTVSSSPVANLDVEVTGRDTLQLTSSNDYVGPAAVMLEVTDKPSGDEQSAAGQDKDYGTAYVSIPVQIGPKVALLRCPDFSVTLNAGGLPRVLDIPTLCHAWVPIGLSLDSVRFSASWSSDPKGVALKAEGTGNRTVRLTADKGAPGGDGVLDIRVSGSDQRQQVKVTVLAASSTSQPASTKPVKKSPNPTMRPVAIRGLKEGGSQSIDLGAYLESPLSKPQCRILSAQVESGKGLTASASGCTLTVKAGASPSPTGSIGLVVTDQPGSDRKAQGRATVSVLAKPGTPGGVSAVADRVAGGQARVSFTPPPYDGGSPITSYRVAWTGGSTGTKTCTASPCTITGLTNGKQYTFQVWAVNAIGESNTPGGPSNAVEPDTKPEQITSVSVTGRGDGYLDIAWQPPVNKGSAIVKYNISVVDAAGKTTGIQSVAGGVTTYRARNLDNNQVQNVRVQAANKLGPGPWSAQVQGQSAGKPAPIQSLVATPSTPTPNTDNATMSLRWSPTPNVNGPPITKYTVNRRVAGGGWTAIATTPPGRTSQTDTIPYDGKRYEWMVTVTNGGALTSDPGNVAGYTSNGIPGNLTVNATEAGATHKVTVTVTLGPSHSSGYSRLSWSGNGGSGTVACPCGGTKTFTTTTLNPVAQRITVRATNNGGSPSPPGTSGSVTPYGPTPIPTGLNHNVNDRTVSWSWNLPTDGRSIDDVQVTGTVSSSGSVRTSISHAGGYAQQMCIRVRSHSAAGWSGWTGSECGTTVDPPQPRISNVHLGSPQHPGNAGGSCASGCPSVLFNIDNFPGNATYNIWCDSTGHGRVDSSYDLHTNGAGNGYSWSGYCVYDPNGAGTISVHIGSWSGHN